MNREQAKAMTDTELDRLASEYAHQLVPDFEVSEPRGLVKEYCVSGFLAGANLMSQKLAIAEAALEKLLLAAVHWDNCERVTRARKCNCYVQTAREALAEIRGRPTPEEIKP